MTEFKLQPADILVNVNNRNDLWSRIRRWCVGSYSHVFLYMGEVIVGPVGQRRRHIPMLFESNGRGVVLQTLSNRYGQDIMVMRMKKGPKRVGLPDVLDEAVKLASDPQAYYD